MLASLREALAGSWVQSAGSGGALAKGWRGALNWESRTSPKGTGTCRDRGGTASPSSPEAHIQKQAQFLLFLFFFKLLNTCTSQAPCAGTSFRNSHCECCAAVHQSSLKQRGEQIWADLLKGSRLLLRYSQLWFSFEEERRQAGSRGSHPSPATVSLSHPRQVHPQPEAQAIPLSVLLLPRSPHSSCTRNCESQSEAQLNVSGNSNRAGKSHKIHIFH